MPGAAGPFLPNPIGFPPLVLCPSPSHAVSPMIPTEMLLSVPIPSVALHPQDDPFAWAPHSSACRRTASDTDWNLSHFCYPPPPPDNAAFLRCAQKPPAVFKSLQNSEQPKALLGGTAERLCAGVIAVQSLPRCGRGHCQHLHPERPG